MPLIRKPPERTHAPAAPLDLDAALASASADERWRAAREAGLPGHVPALARALAGETDGRVREALFTALARIGTPDGAEAVTSFIRSDDASLRAGALDALRAMPAAAHALAPSLLADPDADVRLLACDLVRDVAAPDGALWLSRLLEVEPRANVCAAAVETLAEIGDATVIGALRGCAARFPDDPFLDFAIKTTIDRLASAAKGLDG